MYHELSPAEYQRLQETAEQVARQLRRQALLDAQDALYRHTVRAWRSAWRLAVRLARHRRQRAAHISLRTQG
jgi:hypothetical protein